MFEQLKALWSVQMYKLHQKLGKKGFEFNMLTGVAITMVLLGVILGVGAIILDKFANTSGIGVTAKNMINNTLKALAEIPNTWLGIIITAIVAAVVIAILIRSFGGGGRK